MQTLTSDTPPAPERSTWKGWLFMAQTVSLPVHEIYGGAELWWNVGRDNCRYTVICAAPSRVEDIRAMAFRQHPDGRTERLNFDATPPIGVRPSVVETADQAFVLWMNPGNRSFTVCVLPFYVPRAYTGTVPPSIPITPAPPAAPSGPVRDEAAHKGLADAQKAIKALEGRLKALEGRPQPATLTERNVDDRVWAKLPDAMYGHLASDNQGLIGQIRRIVGPMIPTREAIKAIVREVLAEPKK